MAKYIAAGKFNDIEIQASIQDLNAFISSAPNEDVFVEDDDENTYMIRKDAVKWISIIQTASSGIC